MEAYTDGKNHLLRFDRGEEVMTTLLDWARQEKPAGGFLSGLGAVRNPHLGYFDAEKRTYMDKEFQGEFEITSLAGNLGWEEEKPVAHVHVGIAGPNFLSFGGHLYTAVVSGTVEIAVITFGEKLVRKHNKDLNLKLLD